MRKVRPQVLIAIIFLGLGSGFAMHLGYPEIGAGGIGGIIALATRLIEGNSRDD